MVKSDARFEVPAARHLGMVVFRLKGPNDLTEILLKKINTSGKLHCVPAALKVFYCQQYFYKTYFSFTVNIFCFLFLGKLCYSFYGDFYTHKTN